MSEWFDDFAEELDPVERERLRRTHELLVEAGQPPELPRPLEHLPTRVGRARTIPFPQLRSRIAAGVALAAALAAAAFGGGYLLGDRDQTQSAAKPVRVATMIGSNATGTLRVDAHDANGNWPIRFTVRGLPRLTGKYGYYEVFVKFKGKLVYPCGGFRVGSVKPTSVSFVVPYEVTNTTQWVVTAIDDDDHWPGRVVMT